MPTTFDHDSPQLRKAHQESLRANVTTRKRLGGAVVILLLLGAIGALSFYFLGGR